MDFDNHLISDLQSTDPGTRSLAISKLAEYDADEAQRHLEYLLLGDDRARKTAALQACVLLPFSLVKPSLLKFFIQEDDEPLLKRAGLTFSINPDPEVPYHLLELMDSASMPSGKERALRETLQGAFQAIKDSGILRQDFPSYVERLKNAIEERKAILFIRKALEFLESEDSLEQEEGKAAILKNFHKPFVKAAAGKVLALPLSRIGLDRLQSLIATKTEISSLQIASLGDFREKLSLDDRCRWVAGLQPEEKDSAMRVLPDLLKDPQTPFDLRATAFRAARRLSMEGLTGIAEKFLSHPEESLLIAALSYAAQFDAENILPYIGRYLKDSRPRVRSTALSLLKRVDAPQAISSLMAMLKSSDLKNRTAAISCMTHFDFFLLRDPLVDLLEAHADESIISAALCFFRINPNPENLYFLYRLSRQLTADFTERINATVEVTENLLLSMGFVNSGTLEKLKAGFPGRYAREREKALVPPAYSLKKIKEAEENIGKNILPTAANIFQQPLFTLSLAVSLVFFIIAAHPFSESPEMVVNVDSGAIPSFPVEIIGTIIECLPNNREVIVKTVDETIFQVRMRSSFPVAVGNRIKALVEPFRFSKDRIFARFQSAEKLE